MDDLKTMHCKPPKIGGPSLTFPELEPFLPQISGWEISDVDDVMRLTRQFKFKNFVTALNFTNHVGELAEREDHHPSILTEWGKVTITWWTHAVHGLHINDLICAAKTDQIFGD
jgi:4a-hydroxytetrahydrobiopterin dehydratase